MSDEDVIRSLIKRTMNETDTSPRVPVDDFYEADAALNSLTTRLAEAQEKVASYQRLEATDQKHLDDVLARLAEAQAEVREWLCAKCNTVYPGPPQEGVWCVVCPRCGGDTGLRNAMELRAARTRLAEVERERDELRKERFTFGVLQESQAQAALRSQLTQAREALERIARELPMTREDAMEGRDDRISVLQSIARQALATINREGETPKEDGDACPKCGMTSRPVWNSERRAYDNRGCGHWWHAEGINYSTPTRTTNREGEAE